MTKQLFNAYCMIFLFLKLLWNFRWGVANIRRKLTIYSGFILLESLV
ncbi:type II secretion system protein, partial [Enterococcus faecalis]